MVREVLTINIGQCGIQLGSSIWTQYCAEHLIQKDGRMKDDIKSNDQQDDDEKKSINDNSFHIFFEETINGQFVPRNLSVDLEPNCIDDIKNSSWSQLYRHEFLLNGFEDAANNFARGYYTVGREIFDKVNDKIRKLFNSCDNLQGFMINHSVCGGTGSGLTSLILEKFGMSYRKKSRIGFEIYPSPNLTNCVTEPYNSLFTTNYLIDNSEISLILDNESIYKICQKHLNIKRPSYNNLNKLISKCISSMTCSLRFQGELNIDMQEYETNLVPFPRQHFMITNGINPIINKIKKQTSDLNNVIDISNECFNYKNFFITINDFDIDDDKYMAILLNYRGNIKGKDSNIAINWLKNNKKISFVDWVPTGFKIGLNDMPCALVENDDMELVNRNVTMIGNNSCINRVFMNRICKKSDLMYSQRAFVHWYVGEGMEEGEFEEARENLSFLEKDYLDVLSDDVTDKDDDKNDDDDDDEEF